jgi:NAD(P)-dependent dehydrogenase (short-subunit alcohol dehydrogenase family)
MSPCENSRDKHPGKIAMSKVMVITGASRGIGAAVARLAAQRGYDVCVNYQSRRAAAEQVVADIVALGRRAIAVQADVSIESEVARLFETVDTQLGRVDALVNNVGVLEKQMRVQDMDAARIARVLNANVISAFICSREAIRRMSTEAGGTGGCIVNVSSAASRLGSPNEYVDYAASKGAMDTFTIGLAKEVAAQGIRVNSVRPGVIYTEIHASGGEAGRVDRVRLRVPMQRGGKVEEVATAVLWLASDEASYATGAFIDVAGGI